MAWTRDQLGKLAKEEEIQLASLRENGSLGKPTTMWVVLVGDDLFVRSVHGREGKWWQHAQEKREGHISSRVVESDVVFEEADPRVYDHVDAEYQAKYGHYSQSIVDTVLTPEARESTLKLEPK